MSNCEKLENNPLQKPDWRFNFINYRALRRNTPIYKVLDETFPTSNLTAFSTTINRNNLFATFSLSRAIHTANSYGNVEANNAKYNNDESIIFQNTKNIFVMKDNVINVSKRL